VKSWSEYCENYKRKRIKKCADAVCTTFNNEGFTYELHHTDTEGTVLFENKDGRPVISVKEESQEKKDCLIRQKFIRQGEI